MDFGGKYVINAPRIAVWDALNDTEVLKEAIPGCTRIDWVADDALEAAISVNLGVVKPEFTGELLLSDIVPAEHYTLSGRGKGGMLGHAHGAAAITLSDHESGTLLAFTAEGGGSGRLMKLGKSLIGSSAQKVIDGFFMRFAEAMNAELTVVPSEPDPV